MKKIAIILIGVSMLLSSCKKDLDRPPIPAMPTNDIWTVGQILDTLANGTFQFGDTYHKDAVVKGYVIADESGGNIYRTVYLRGEDGRCIAVYRSGSTSYTVSIGDHIGIKLDGAVISEYSRLPQIQLQADDPNSLIVIYERECLDKVQPVVTDVESVNAGNHLCDLVQLNDVQFETYEGLSYTDGNTTTNRSLISCSGESIIVRTSGYADFGEEPLPQGRGSLISIVSVYNTTWQLAIRNTRDVFLNGHRCGEGGDVMELPYHQSFASSFGTYTTYSVLGDQVWIIDFSTAKMTGYANQTNYENEDWLLSSPVIINNVEHAMATVNYVAQYTGFDDDVTLQVSSDYEFGDDPTNATWTKLDVEFPNTGGWYDFQDVAVSLDEYIGDTVTLAVKFLSTTEKSRTLEVKSIYIDEGTPTPPPATIFSEPFIGHGIGDFTINNVYLAPGLSYVWKYNEQYGMVASAFTNNTSYQSDSWLISPSIDMVDYHSAVLTFDHAANKLNSGSPSQFYFVMVSTDYDPNSPDDAHWTQLEVPNYPAGTNWTFVSSGEIDMSAYLGYENVHIAFKYTSETDNSGSWEIKNVLVKE